MIGFPLADYWQNTFIGQWLFTIHATCINLKLPIDNCGLIVKNAYPTSACRNQIVEEFLANPKNDFLYMVDADNQVPMDWFEVAFNFLMSQKEPTGIGCPYTDCMGKVNVMRWTTINNEDPPFIKEFSREEAAVKKDIEEVSNLGTGCIAYSRKMFEIIKPPYFEYTMNEQGTLATETEDCLAHRKMTTAGGKLFCAWGHWSHHLKTQMMGRPHLIDPHKILQFSP